MMPPSFLPSFLPFYAVVSFFWLCFAIRRPLSLSLSLSRALSLYPPRVCARAYLRPRPFTVGAPVVFGPSPRSLNALWHRAALRPGRQTQIPRPPLLPLFFLLRSPSLPPLLPLTPTRTYKHSTHTYRHTHTQLHFYCPFLYIFSAHIGTFLCIKVYDTWKHRYVQYIS